MAVVGVADERAGQLPRVFIVPGDNLTKEAVTILINKNNHKKNNYLFPFASLSPTRSSLCLYSSARKQ